MVCRTSALAAKAEATLKGGGNREAEGSTSSAGQWRDMTTTRTPPLTVTALDRLCDMGIPPSLIIDDGATIGDIVIEEIETARRPRVYIS